MGTGLRPFDTRLSCATLPTSLNGSTRTLENSVPSFKLGLLQSQCLCVEPTAPMSCFVKAGVARSAKDHARLARHRNRGLFQYSGLLMLHDRRRQTPLLKPLL